LSAKLYILAVSDIHERVVKLLKVKEAIERRGFTPNLVIVAGDLTYFKNVDTALRIVTKIKDLFKTTVFFVPGNCDPPDLLDVKEVGSEALNLHRRVVSVGNYVFAGIGGSGITPFYTMIEYTEQEFREFIEEIAVKKRQLQGELVMVTHQPVHGFFDHVNGVNVGSRVFAESIEYLKPLLWITGHIHEHSGWTRTNGTVIVHPGPLMRGYYAIITLEGSSVESVEINRVE
jgi:Icc-related predicted phosphoesterase